MTSPLPARRPLPPRADQGSRFEKTRDRGVAAGSQTPGAVTTLALIRLKESSSPQAANTIRVISTRHTSGPLSVRVQLNCR